MRLEMNKFKSLRNACNAKPLVMSFRLCISNINFLSVIVFSDDAESQSLNLCYNQYMVIASLCPLHLHYLCNIPLMYYKFEEKILPDITHIQYFFSFALVNCAPVSLVGVVYDEIRLYLSFIKCYQRDVYENGPFVDRQ